MDSSGTVTPRLSAAVRQWFRDASRQKGTWPATKELASTVWEFVRDSTPDRLRARFGDAEYDWDYRVNTTSGAVGWRDRLLGMFHSSYQPTEPTAFRQMIAEVQHWDQTDLRDFFFVDLGSGKGRTLLMASDYPFRRIVGVELLPSLHKIAQENLAKYHGETQRCFALESLCADATAFSFPPEPIVLYLFNPFPEAGLRRVLANLEQSLRAHPRPFYLLYHNPVLENALQNCAVLEKLVRNDQYSMYRFRNDGTRM